MTPSLILIPRWLKLRSAVFKDVSYVGYFSAHATTVESLGIFVAQELQTDNWLDLSHLLKYDANDVACRSLHGPDVHVDNLRRRLFMYVHGHGCIRANGDGNAFSSQPTFKFESHDGIIWHPSHAEKCAHVRNAGTSEGVHYRPMRALVAEDLFYTRMIYHNDEKYIFGKSQEDPEGYLTIKHCDLSRGLHDPRVRLLRGVRHFSLHKVQDILFIFFTLISDAPERIMLGTIDLSRPWLEWQVSPGPILAEPEMSYENGGAEELPSRAGSADCTARKELRDPFFYDTESSTSVLRGWLVYALKGEGGFALAVIELNLLAYLPLVDPFFSRRIPPEIVRASSLAGRGESLTSLVSPALVTGTGRSGTMYVCRLFNQMGINISHDNDVDCGDFPGAHGSSSWYHAFHGPLPGTKFEKVLFKRVVHVVRHPLDTITSRAKRLCTNSRDALPVMRATVGGWEDTSALNKSPENMTFAEASSWSLKHWVHRNTFVHQCASWRARVEDLARDNWYGWSLCVAMGLGPQCGLIKDWGSASRAVSSRTNAYSNEPDESQQGQERNCVEEMKGSLTWDQLSGNDPESENYVRIALKIAKDWGYEFSQDTLHRYDVDNVNFTCLFSESKAGSQLPWACVLES